MKTQKSGAATDRPRRWQIQLARTVAECYTRMRNLQPAIAQNLDDTPGARSMRWSPESCHFCVDVEHGLRDAIADQPDKAELLRAWQHLLEDSSTIREKEARLVTLLAPIFSARQLDPREYFRPVRRRA